MERRRLIAVALCMLMLMVAAACGQKPGVDKKIEGLTAIGGGVALPPGATVDEEGNIVDAEGNVIGNVEEGITDPSFAAGGTSTDPTGGGDTGPGDDGGDDGGGLPDDGGGGEPGGGSAEGVTDDVIKIGIHAPLTGAAPVPSDSVDKGKDLYFRWMADKKQTLFGRRVEVVLKNDQYNPSTAVAVCKEMVEKDKVFLLSGAAGTDQIQACARYAQDVGVPYLSAGVTESLVSSFRTYFATSMTYPDQGPLLVQYMTKKLGAKGERNGLVITDTASFNDATAAFLSAADKAGMDIAYQSRPSKNAGTSEARSIVQELNLQRIENVFVLTSPIFFINMLKQANTQGYAPQWTGVGISMTFDTVASVGCGEGTSLDGARFFSPFPAYIDSNKFDPEFRQASAQFYPSKTPDDFMWLSWLGGRVAWDLMKQAGQNLTRERFIYFAERARNLKTGIGPVLNYSPTDHFGADQVHVNEARCSDRRWHTIETFKSSF